MGILMAWQNCVKVLIPRGQLSFYEVGFEGEERDINGGYIRTTKTISIDPVTSTITKRVMHGAWYEVPSTWQH
jgi:hypothetical protein